MTKRPSAHGKGILWDDRWYHPDELPSDPNIDMAEAHGLNQAGLVQLCERFKGQNLFFKGLTATDLSPLSALSQLTSLQITWAHKFTDASPLRKLSNLVSLTLSDTKRWQNLDHIAGMDLGELDLSGGMGNDNIYETLEPLASLKQLERLILASVKVKTDGLKPLAKCKSLKELQLDFRFPTEDYAYLSVHMPQTNCEAFAPYVPMEFGYNHKDMMVVGFRKPALSSKTDSARLAKYAAAFEALQAQFRKECLI